MYTFLKLPSGISTNDVISHNKILLIYQMTTWHYSIKWSEERENNTCIDAKTTFQVGALETKTWDSKYANYKLH